MQPIKVESRSSKKFKQTHNPCQIEIGIKGLPTKSASGANFIQHRILPDLQRRINTNTLKLFSNLN